MKTFEKVVLAVGAATLAVLLWTMDPPTVGRLVLQVGWGMALIVPQEAVAYVLNALGWRFAFTAQQAGSFPLAELVRLRIAGDAINYLTPSATIAGEVARTTMLNRSHGVEVRAASVTVAKCAQTLGQILLAVTGVIVVAGGYFAMERRHASAVYAVGAGFALALALLAFSEVRAGRRPGARAATAPAETEMGLRAFGRWLRHFFRMHPGRFAASTTLFLLAYAWGAFEAYWICYFLKAPVSISTAMTIEVLSVAIDGLLFMVPAKAGTQEGGKTAIFAALGLAPSAGFAFGVVRHLRELTWAGVGLTLYAAHTPAPAPDPVSRSRRATSPR